MAEILEFHGLKLTPVKLKFSEEELKKKIIFEGSISSEHLTDVNFTYYLMPKKDLAELLALTGRVQDVDHQRLYHITGSLITSDLKHEEVNGYYFPTRWGFIPVNIFG